VPLGYHQPSGTLFLLMGTSKPIQVLFVLMGIRFWFGIELLLAGQQKPACLSILAFQGIVTQSVILGLCKDSIGESFNLCIKKSI